jgi:hypothetical protein
MRSFGTPFSEGESYSGISYFEGKLVFVGTLAIGVWVGLGLGRKGWLPGGLLAAGAVQTFAVVVLFGLRSQLAAGFAEIQSEQAELRKFMGANPMTKPMESIFKESDSTLLPVLRGGVGWALGLAIVLTLTAAVSFAVASRRRPLAVAFFEKPGTAPLVQRYGALTASYGLAFLLGIVVVVFRH